MKAILNGLTRFPGAVFREPLVPNLASFIGLVKRFVLIGICALLPLLLIMVQNAQEDRERALLAARDRVSLIASVVADRQTHVLDQARSMLRFLASAAEVSLGGQACDVFRGRHIGLYPWIGELRVSALDGNALCGDRPAAERPNIADRSYFRRIVGGAEFAVSEFLIGRASGKPTIIAAVPLMQDGRTTGVVSAAIELEIFSQVLRPSNGDPEDLFAFVVDANGVLFARYPPSPDLIGKNLGDSPVVERALQNPAGAAQLPSLTGEPSLFAFRKLGGTGATVAVGLRRASIIDSIEAASRMRLLLIAGLFAGSILIAAAGAELLILRPLRSLAGTARSLASGKLDARSGVTGVGEVATLARALDSMAEAVQDRERQLRGAKEEAEQGRASHSHGSS